MMDVLTLIAILVSLCSGLVIGRKLAERKAAKAERESKSVRS